MHTPKAFSYIPGSLYMNIIHIYALEIIIYQNLNPKTWTLLFELLLFANPQSSNWSRNFFKSKSYSYISFPLIRTWLKCAAIKFHTKGLECNSKVPTLYSNINEVKFISIVNLSSNGTAIQLCRWSVEGGLAHFAFHCSKSTVATVVSRQWHWLKFRWEYYNSRSPSCA